MLTLVEALQYNKARPVSKQSTQQVRNWYKQGFALTATGLWVSTVDGRPKYSTAN